MISKAKSRYIKQLQVKKYRLAEQSFIVQGAKAVLETLASDWVITTLAGTNEFFQHVPTALMSKVRDVMEVSIDELTELGSVDNNDAALAVVKMKESTRPTLGKGEFGIMLDDLRDPGNFGTIIRTAEWYGIQHIVASPETTDFYNPKVISASMGSFLRINVYYALLEQFIKEVSVPVYGTFLEGDNVHQVNFAKGGWIVVGNESRGISAEVGKCITDRITIPRYGHAESLNASTATAIVLDNIRRRS